MIAVLAAGAAVSAIETGASLGKVPVFGEKITVDGKTDAIYDKGLNAWGATTGGSTIAYSDATKSTDAKKFGCITLSGDKVSISAATTAATQKASAASGSSAATFDGGIVIAALAAVPAASVVVSKKRR